MNNNEQVCCPHCQNELEKIQACGAVDYFCNHCNLLISKKAVIRKPAKPQL